MDQKCQCLAKIANFGPSLAVLWPNFLFHTGESKSFGSHIIVTKLWSRKKCFTAAASDDYLLVGRFLSDFVAT